MMKIERVDSELRREISNIVSTKVNDPRVRDKMISIMHVETTRDLKYCKVYVELPGGGNAHEAVQGLQSSAGFIRSELFKNLRIRTVPELIFVKDGSTDYAFKIENIIKNIRNNEEN